MSVQELIDLAKSAFRDAVMANWVNPMFTAEGHVATDKGAEVQLCEYFEKPDKLADGTVVRLIKEFMENDKLYTVLAARIFRIAEGVTLHVMELTDDTGTRSVMMLAHEEIKDKDPVIRLAKFHSNRPIAFLMDTEKDFRKHA